MPPRVLILTASVGEGHDLPARTLSEQLLEECPDVEVVIEDCIPVLGRTVAAISERAPSYFFFRFSWLWDLGFWVVAERAITRLPTQWLLTRFGMPGILRLIDSVRPDVVVSVYPTATEVVGRLRREGKLDVPFVAAITDLAAMHYWATPGADLHLVTHPESIEEVYAVAGRDSVVRCVHGLTAAAFRAPRSVADARAALELPNDGAVVLVSGGGWGVGDVESAVEEALTLPSISQVVCLCGRNEQLFARALRHFGRDPRVRVEGFTEQMPDWLAAADALVHATGGLTVLEALMRGCPAISYGWGRGHVRLNNEAFRRFGLAQVAGTRAELRTALVAALAGGRTWTDSFRDLPSAASLVLEAAGAA